MDATKDQPSQPGSEEADTNETAASDSEEKRWESMESPLPPPRPGQQESSIPKKYHWLILGWATDRKLSAREIVRRLEAKKKFKTSHGSVIRLLRQLGLGEFMERSHENLTATLASDECTFEELLGETLRYDALAEEESNRGNTSASRSHHRSADRCLRMATMLDRRCARNAQALQMQQRRRKRSAPSPEAPPTSAKAPTCGPPDADVEDFSDIPREQEQLGQLVNELKTMLAHRWSSPAIPTHPASPAAPDATGAVARPAAPSTSAPSQHTTSSSASAGSPEMTTARKPAASMTQPEVPLSPSTFPESLGKRVVVGMVWLLIGVAQLPGAILNSFVGRGWTASESRFTNPREVAIRECWRPSTASNDRRVTTRFRQPTPGGQAWHGITSTAGPARFGAGKALLSASAGAGRCSPTGAQRVSPAPEKSGGSCGLGEEV